MEEFPCNFASLHFIADAHECINRRRHSFRLSRRFNAVNFINPTEFFTCRALRTTWTRGWISVCRRSLANIPRRQTGFNGIGLIRACESATTARRLAFSDVHYLSIIRTTESSYISARFNWIRFVLRNVGRNAWTCGYSTLSLGKWCTEKKKCLVVVTTIAQRNDYYKLW